MRRGSTGLAFGVGAAAFGVYVLTACRTISFWEGAQYALLARTLSIANPPGSLLLTLIGRWLGDLPVAWPMAFRLSLIAAFVGSQAAGVVSAIGVRVAGETGVRAPFALAGGAVAGLTWAFGVTPWSYATQFTPYGLSALFTALVLGAFVRWWDRAESSDAAGSAALVALLLGLDLSVHRANLLLVPAVLAGVVLRRPRALLRPRLLAASGGAFALGAALQLLYIPISQRKPFLDVAAPSSLAGLWSYFRMDPMGGGFLVHVWPRESDFLRVQLWDLARFVMANLGGSGWVWPLGVLLVLGGLAALSRRSPRLAWALSGFALAAGLGTVAYFNRPVSYFRTLDRHYLVFLVTLMPWLAAGVASMGSALQARLGKAAGIVAVLLALALPVSAVIANFPACDLSHTRFAETYARDMVEPLARDALLVTNGDNDSFPPWYLQQVEGMRPDVLIVNASTAWTRHGTQRVRRADPSLASFAPSESLLVDLARRCLGRRPVYFAATLVLPASMPGIAENLRLEGLVWRVAPPGEQRSDSLLPLERFIHERLPRAGFDDPRQRLEEGMKLMGSNYAAAGFQLAYKQLAQGDGRAALTTIDTLERYYPTSRWPSGSEMGTTVTKLRQWAKSMLAADGEPR